MSLHLGQFGGEQTGSLSDAVLTAQNALNRYKQQFGTKDTPRLRQLIQAVKTAKAAVQAAIGSQRGTATVAREISSGAKAVVGGGSLPSLSQILPALGGIPGSAALGLASMPLLLGGDVPQPPGAAEAATPLVQRVSGDIEHFLGGMERFFSGGGLQDPSPSPVPSLPAPTYEDYKSSRFDAAKQVGAQQLNPVATTPGGREIRGTGAAKIRGSRPRKRINLRRQKKSSSRPTNRRFSSRYGVRRSTGRIGGR